MDKSQRPFFIFLLILGLALSFWFLRGRSRKQSDIENTTSTDTVTMPALNAQTPVEASPRPFSRMTIATATSSPVPQIPPSSASGVTNLRKHSPPPHAVPYKLEGNLAVAYGDIALGIMDPKNTPPDGYAKTAPLELWSGNIIPYTISPKLTNPERVLRVIAYFNDKTPVRFIPWQGQRDALVFEPSEKICMSYLGHMGGIQPVYLASGCHDHEITHEIMHALGFIHEQSRPDRDQYIKINWNLIEPEAVSQFETAPAELVGPVEHRRFDYTSIMLYPPTMFAKNHGEKVLESMTGETIDPVQEGLSREDIDRVYALYGH